jgi:hypothetical protein
MQSTPNPNQTEPDDLLVIAPDIVLVARADKEFSNLAHDAMSRPWDSQTHMASDFSAGPSVLPVDTTFRAAAVDNAQVPGDRRSIVARAMRACIGFLLAVCIGVASIVWQSYGDAAKQIVARWVPQFALTSSSPQDNPGLPEQPSPPAVQASAAKAAPPQPVPSAQTATAPEGVAPAGAALSPESTQVLQSMAGDLAHAEQEIEQLKASIAQLKASQQQISRDSAKVSEARVAEAKASEAKASGAKASGAKASGAKASEQNLRSRLSAAVRRSAAAPARKPMPPFPPSQAAAAPPQAAAPPVPQQQPQTTAQPQAELVPRPPMPVR